MRRRGETVPWVRIPPSPPRSSSLPYPILRFECIRLYDSKAKPTNSAAIAVAGSSAMFPVVTAQTVVFDRGLGRGVFRQYTVLLCIPLFEATAKTTSSAIKAVAASSAILPLVTAQTVGSGRGAGGCISRWTSRRVRTHPPRIACSPVIGGKADVTQFGAQFTCDLQRSDRSSGGLDLSAASFMTKT